MLTTKQIIAAPYFMSAMQTITVGTGEPLEKAFASLDQTLFESREQLSAAHSASIQIAETNMWLSLALSR